jgi:sugar phosphate isomerase/epimerase
MLSISTSWNHTPDLNMRQWLGQIKDIGFHAIELGYTLTIDQVNDLLPLLPEMGIQVSSIHNFCPVPYDEVSPRHPSNHYRLSSSDVYERKKAVEWTNRTIDLAVKVKAPVVVIHAGTLEFPEDPSKVLLQLYKDGQVHTPTYEKARLEFLQLRERHKTIFLKNLEESLTDVMNYAVSKRVKIGLETRYYPIEIPNFEEVGYFLDIFGKQGMYYWHDVGHAEINDRLKIRPHTDFLKTYASRMVGMHIHGMKIARDHLAPFDGDLDFDKIKPFLAPSIIKVVEARYATAEQLKVAYSRLA